MASASVTAPTIRLKDYKPFPYRIPSIALDVVIGSDAVKVTCLMELNPVLGSEPQALEFQGVDLVLESISIDHNELDPSDYSLTNEQLVIHQPPQLHGDVRRRHGKSRNFRRRLAQPGALLQRGS